MSYLYWPSGLPPYTPKTYIADGITLLNHSSIESGIATDVAYMQHHINTTHLFASGWTNPIMSGFFKNVDVLSIYATNVYSQNFSLYNLNLPYIDSCVISGSLFYAKNSAFVNNNIQATGSFNGEVFTLNSNGLTYSPNTISGGLFPYILSSGSQNILLNGDFSTLNIVSGNISIDANHNVMIESFNGFNPIGTLSESGIYWNAFGGHTHQNNKILAKNILDDLIDYNGDLSINSHGDGLIIASGGVINADTYVFNNSYNDTDFYLINHSLNGTYSGNSADSITYTNKYISDALVYREPASGNRPVMGNLSDLDIGLSKMVSFNGQVWATSKTLPTGCTDTSKTFIYTSTDLCTWTAILISGWFDSTVGSNAYIAVSGNASINDIIVHRDDIYILWNMSVSSGNYCSMFGYNTYYSTLENTKGVNFGLGSGGFGSSKYGIGLASIDEYVSIFGYEYPHIWASGLHKWDRDCIYYDNGTIKTMSTASTGISSVLSGVIYSYEYPFMNIYNPSLINLNNNSNNIVWLDGSINKQNPCLSSVNSGVFDAYQKTNVNFSGYYTGFFGNGFSEITSVLPITIPYHGGKKGYFKYRKNNDNNYFYEADLIDNYSYNPVLVFGSFLAHASGTGGNIFGGCIPLVMNLDRRLFTSNATYGNVVIASGNALFAPNVLHGARSLLDNNYTYRLPSILYNYSNSASGLANSNLWQAFPGNSGRLWTDLSSYAFNGTRDALINICPWQPGYGVFPYGAASNVYYKHDNEITPTKLVYTTYNSNGLLIPSGYYQNSKSMPTYYDRTILDGFWSSKSFDWYYMPSSGQAPEAPSGSYPKTYYYMKPKNPIQHNGSIYCSLEYNTGFIYIGPDGPIYVDDSIMYSDMVKYGNTIYGIGSKVTSSLGTYNYRVALTKIKHANSKEINIPNSITSGKKTPCFVVHNNTLYAGLGKGIFLVKKPSHSQLCITSSL